MSDDYDKDEAQKVLARIEEAVAAIRPHLAGRGSKDTGAILADLVSMWVGGFLDEATAESMLTLFISCVRQLTPLNRDRFGKSH